MAPDRSVGSPGRSDETHRLPRNHQTGHPRSDRETPHGGHEPRECPAGPSHPRPPRGLRALARALEEGAAVALGGPRAERGRAAARGARTRDHRFPLDPLFPRRGPVPCRGRSRQDALPRRALDAFRHARRGAALPRKLHGRRLHRGQGRGETRPPLPCAAFHHLHAATGGRAQARNVRVADHVGGAAPLRAGSDHLHAYRLGEPLATGAGPVQGGDHQALRRTLLVVAQLQDQDQGRAGGARGHPSVVHRPPVDRGHVGREASLRPDLEAHRGLADGVRRNRPHDGHHRHHDLAAAIHGPGRSGALRRFPASLLRVHRRRADRAERRGAAAEDGAGRPADRRADHRHRALHTGPGPLQRSLARQAT